MLLQLLVELQGDANHHFGLVPIGVGDVVQDAIEICGRGEKVTNGGTNNLGIATQLAQRELGQTRPS